MPKTFRINLYLNEPQMRHLEAVAARYGIALTDAARRIIDADAERTRRERSDETPEREDKPT